MLKFDSLPSTNSWALEHLPDLKHGDVIQAHHQSAGRGRFDRQWLSPPGTCLTLSVILESPSPGDPLTVAITRMSACSVRLTLENSGIPGMLKWPNDVLVANRKIAGILAKRDADAGKLVLGIGLNVNLPAETLASQEFLQPATSMAIEGGTQADICLVRKDLLHNLETMLAMDVPSLQEHWAAHDALTGQRITINTVHGPRTGIYAGIDDTGRLLLELPDQSVQRFDSGDVSISPLSPEH